MVDTTRFITFVLMFILLHARNSTALSTHQGELKLSAKFATGNVFAPAAMSNEVSDKRLRGRKMMLKSVLRKEMRESQVLNTEDRKISGAADDTVGNCKKGILDGKCKLMVNNRISSHPLKKKKMVNGLTTFSADYHVPKSHPPKNNR